MPPSEPTNHIALHGRETFIHSCGGQDSKMAKLLCPGVDICIDVDETCEYDEISFLQLGYQCTDFVLIKREISLGGPGIIR